MIALIHNIQAVLHTWLQKVPGMTDQLSQLAVMLISVTVVVVFALVINRFIVLFFRWLITKIIARAPSGKSGKWKTALQQHLIARRSAHIVTVLIVYWLLPAVMDGFPELLKIIQSLIIDYMVILVILAINAMVRASGDVYEDIEHKTGLPVEFVSQTMRIITWVVGSIVLVSVVFNVSITVLLGSLAGISAVSMLVFRDSILGFVAGIMLTANDMLHVGDWIEAPQYQADGTVIDLGLTTVKVQNFDNTISTIPSYSLFSESFRNWRGMYKSKARRINRAISIDMDSVQNVTDAMLVHLKQIKILQDYLNHTLADIETNNQKLVPPDNQPPNTRQQTNLGVFRIYLENYLKQHPDIHTDMTIMVRHLSPGAEGLPLEIYAFSKEQRWDLYERIQADIIEHVLTTLPIFGLRVFQLLDSKPK